MSEREESFRSHPIHTTLGNLADIMDGDVFKTEDANILSAIDRINQVVIYTKTVLDNCIPALCNPGSLKQSNSHLQNVLNEVNSYASNSNPGHLTNTNNHIDTLINSLSNFPYLKNEDQAGSISEMILSFKSQAEGVIDLLRKEKDKLQSNIEAVKNGTYISD